MTHSNMKYDLKDIILFANVAKFKSFARASEILKISKSVVSNRISELEKSLRLSLLVRTTRAVNLTRDGEIFLDYCESIIEKIENLDEFLQGYNGISGTLKLALPPYFSRYHIVPYLKEFLELYPDLKLDIILTENPVDIINKGIDLQVRIQIPEEEDLEVSKLTNNHKVVCASPDYIKRCGEPKKPRDLLQHNCIVFGENDVWQFKSKTTREIIKINDMDGNIKCDNGEIIKELVMFGIGIALKSARDVEDEIKSNKLITLLNDYEIVNKTQFYAVYPSSKYISPKIRAFVDFFQNKLCQFSPKNQ